MSLKTDEAPESAYGNKPVADLSLAIPMHNSQEFLAELFASIDAQSILPREIIILDDASADASFSEAERLCSRYSWSCCTSLERSQVNLGVAGAYTRLVARSTCEWIQILDADDALDPAFIAGLGLDSIPAEIVAVSGSARCNRFAVNAAYRFFAALGPKRIPRWLPILGLLTTRSAIAYRRSSLLQVHFPNPAFDGSDILHLLRLHDCGEIRFAPAAVVRYRIHDGSVSAGASSERYLSELRLTSAGLLYRLDHFLRKRLFAFMRK